MKTFKIIAITFVFTAIITIAMSVSATIKIAPETKMPEETPEYQEWLVNYQKETLLSGTSASMTKQDLSETELRFRAIEERLSALEAKQ